MDSYGVFGDRLVPGARLYSASTSYKVLSLLSSGTFGKVAKCRKMDSKKTVAVKMFRNQGSFAEQAKIEIDTLQKVKILQNSKRHLVLWKRIFNDMGHICLEFEYLDKSLYDLMKERQFKYFQVKEIRPVVHQLATALEHLKRAHMIHGDIKLENVMLIDHQQQPYRVKLSDLGLGQGDSVKNQNSNKSPEILLGAPFTEATDMWSVGCVAAFLYTGTHLYHGRNEHEMIKAIMETQGQFPEDILVSGQNTSVFFHWDNQTSTWKLRAIEQQDTAFTARDTKKIKLISLNHLQQLQPFDGKHNKDRDIYTEDKQMFVEMLKGMLHLNASQRLTPGQVLAHQFVNMNHLKPHLDISPHAQSCNELMSYCEKEMSRPTKRKSSSNFLKTTSKSSREKHSSTKVHKKSHEATCKSSKRLKSGNVNNRINQDECTNESKQPIGERNLSRTSNPSRLRSKDTKYIKLKTRFAVRFMEEQSAMDENQTCGNEQQHQHHAGVGTILGKDPTKSVL
ncbi:homeodomain-interacting protein kinase 1-like [Stigmatopora nigra]